MATSNTSSITVAAEAATKKRSNMKLNTIRDIEKQMQKLWSDLKMFEVDAPTDITNK